MTSSIPVNRKRLLWLALAVALSILVAYQTAAASSERSAAFVADADIPTVAEGVDVLSGVVEVPARIRGYDYRRAAFGESWTDDNDAPGGHNGCDTRNDILDRDLVDKTYVSISRCPNAVATGTLHDPYTSEIINLVRGNQTGASVQIDHLVPLAFAWDLGARNWTDDMRLRFANDPAESARGSWTGQSGQERFRAGAVDAAQRRVPVPIRDAVHRGAAGLRAARRRAVGRGTAGSRLDLPDELNSRHG